MLGFSTFQFTRMAMKILFALSRNRRLWICGWMAACALIASPLGAQSVAPRITSEIADSEQATLRGSLHPLALSRFDAGRMPSDTKLNGVSLVFSRSAAQEADLEALLAAQQNPASPLYHQWLNPDQFAARFGVAKADLAKVKSWLEQQGFSVDSVARGRSMIRFSGSARQVEGAFSTEMHYYNVEGSRHFAPATELSVPAALAPVVLALGNLNDFRLKPMHIASARPEFTSLQSGAVHFAPGDIVKVYDIKSVYDAGHNGAGQSIAIMGQSAILTSDIEHFQSAAGLPIKDPTLVVVPGSGTSTIYTGDESESDIDLEWSGAVAPGANLIFVYTGDNPNSNGVFDSILYAIDEKLAPIISVSYGACETEFTAANILPYEAAAQQAALQGQTIIASSGDSGSTGCYGFTGLTTAQQKALAVSYPASSAYVTAMGGTEITAAEDVTGPYWEAASGSDLLTSALQYIPEVAWNDDLLGGLSSSGGGVSALISRPAWQTGTIGGASIPSGSYRLVPDISLYSSPNYPGYLFCSSDSDSSILGSCSNGFRDANSKYLTVAGGTSFAAPVFAGMVALLNQAKGYTSGQGLLNPTLYTMAADSATYASAFRDTPTGSNNDCTAGSTICSSTAGFSTGPGYDEVTGLGSVDLANLIAAWSPSQSVATLIGTTTTITASSSTPALNATDTFTITVTAADGLTTPTGSVAISVDSGAAVTVNLNPGSTAGTATGTYQEAFATSGTHQIVAQFAQTATLASSAGTVQVTVPTTGGFTLSASGITVAQGSEGTLAITVTPSGGYTGTVDITPTNSSLSFCYSTTTATVSGTAAVQTSMIIDLKLSDCGLSNTQGGSGMKLFQSGSQKANLSTHASPSIAAAAFSFAGLFLAGLLGWRRRQLRLVCGLLVLGIAGLALSACGGGSSSSSSTSTSTGTKYTLTLTGQDSASSAFSATTTFTLTVQ
jgi:subtilase family serine protease